MYVLNETILVEMGRVHFGRDPPILIYNNMCCIEFVDKYLIIIKLYLRSGF